MYSKKKLSFVFIHSSPLLHNLAIKRFLLLTARATPALVAMRKLVYFLKLRKLVKILSKITTTTKHKGMTQT